MCGCHCSAWAAPQHSPGLALLPPRLHWSYWVAAGGSSCPALKGDTGLNYEQFTVACFLFFALLHNNLLLDALLCPFAVCRIWHNIEHEALEKHAEPEGECEKLLNNMPSNLL